MIDIYNLEFQQSHSNIILFDSGFIFLYIYYNDSVFLTHYHTVLIVTIAFIQLNLMALVKSRLFKKVTFRINEIISLL
jgi:hypothetical protein